MFALKELGVRCGMYVCIYIYICLPVTLLGTNISFYQDTLESMILRLKTREWWDMDEPFPGGTKT